MAERPRSTLVAGRRGALKRARGHAGRRQDEGSRHRLPHETATTRRYADRIRARAQAQEERQGPSQARLERIVPRGRAVGGHGGSPMWVRVCPTGAASVMNAALGLASAIVHNAAIAGPRPNVASGRGWTRPPTRRRWTWPGRSARLLPPSTNVCASSGKRARPWRGPRWSASAPPWTRPVRVSPPRRRTWPIPA